MQQNKELLELIDEYGGLDLFKKDLDRLSKKLDFDFKNIIKNIRRSVSAVSITPNLEISDLYQDDTELLLRLLNKLGKLDTTPLVLILIFFIDSVIVLSPYLRLLAG